MLKDSLNWHCSLIDRYNIALENLNGVAPYLNQQVRQVDPLFQQFSVDIDISPFSLSDPMLVRRYVFSRRSVLNDRSPVAVDTAKVKVANIFRTVVMFGNTTRRFIHKI